MSTNREARAWNENMLPEVVKQITPDQDRDRKLDYQIIGLSLRQWLVLFATSAIVIVLEIHHHSQMWREYQSGQTILTDRQLLAELLIYGLIIPVLVGLTLDYMGRTKSERDKMAKELEIRQELAREFYEARNWQELVESIVRTPGKLVSADRAWLLAQRSAENELENIIHWERPGSDLLPASAPVYPAACIHCLQNVPLTGTRLLACHRHNLENGLSPYNRYCLWLHSTDMVKAALLFDVPADRSLAYEQIRLMDDLVNEMSLAVENINLHDLELRQVDAARQERLKVARDLHDTLGQNVSYLRLKLEQLNTTRLTSDGTEFQDALVDMLSVADEAYDQLRDTLDTLRTTEQRSLEDTIRLYADQAARRGGFSVAVLASGQTGTLSPRQSRQIGYIVREALNNIEKHAGAENVDIHLQWHNSEFELTVRDDGQGFNPRKSSRMDGYGMTIMAERAHAIRADLDVKSAPGEGTAVSLSLPLSNHMPAVAREQ